MSQLSHRPPSNGTGGNITYSIDTFEEGEIEVFVNGVKKTNGGSGLHDYTIPCLLYTSPSPRDYAASRMPSSA